ncbi:putative lipoyl synthase [Burkholderia thailandensis]|uniref:Lipoyl synthase n=1 Tax=Burkholderia thailandensis TaxID=57975 RepID=A0AAW9CZ29_BURTH|nr:putative lipoyl synthase [Burkholderia thailandensis]MDW9254926.1 putative lipoyl synthase [Burkholderia thailandensis]
MTMAAASAAAPAVVPTAARAAAFDFACTTTLGQPGGRSRDKLAPIAVRIVAAGGPALPKPPWRRERRMTRETVAARAAVPRTHRLHSVREAAMRPNLGECFASAPRRS